METNWIKRQSKINVNFSLNIDSSNVLSRTAESVLNNNNSYKDWKCCCLFRIKSQEIDRRTCKMHFWAKYFVWTLIKFKNRVRVFTHSYLILNKIVSICLYVTNDDILFMKMRRESLILTQLRGKGLYNLGDLLREAFTVRVEVHHDVMFK